MKISYEEFRDACTKDLESGTTSMTPGHDEAAAELFLNLNVEGGSMLSELLDTGSVTIRLGDKQYVVSLEVAT